MRPCLFQKNQKDLIRENGMFLSEHLLDPELKEILDRNNQFTLSDEVMLQARQEFKPLEMGSPEEFNVAREEICIAVDDAPDVRCLLYTPQKKTTELRSGYLHMHGGGYIFGAPEDADANNLKICAELGAVVLSVDYRLAPEHPSPAPLDDCYAALAWIHSKCSDLQIDNKRIGIGGESAGGGMAAALALQARDKGEYSICHQHLTYPMLDDRTGDLANPGDPLVGEFVWTRSSNQYAWKAYLGDSERRAPYVPARADSLEGLPATWLHTATLDLFRDENITYAQRLMAAGVATELIVSAGGCHGFQGINEADISRRYRRDFMEALARGLRAQGR